MFLNINDLPDSRYSITKPHNVISYEILFGLGLLTKMALTYEKLIEAHLKRLAQGSKSASIEQVNRNHLTALRSFLKSVKKTESSPVGVELTTDFESSVKLHLAESTLGERSSGDRRSLLNAWRLTFELTGSTPESKEVGHQRRSASLVDVKMSKFEIGLRQALQKARLSLRAASRKAGIGHAVLACWARGAVPNKRSHPSLLKLEVALGLPARTLIDRLEDTRASMESTSVIESRKRGGELTKLPYHLKGADISEPLIQEWREFYDHKTGMRPILKRSAKGQWSLADASVCSAEPTRMNAIGASVSATANYFWSFVAAYLGFLCLPKCSGGYGLNKNDVQTIAWLAVPEAFDAYLRFRTDRSGGLKHGSHIHACTSVASLTHATTGYLAQTNLLSQRIPVAALKNRTWEAMCQEAHELAGAWKRESNDQSRDPSAPLKYFFGQQFPLQPIFDTMRKLRAQSEVEPAGSVAEAIARRDELILGLILSNPLRAKNVKTMTCKSNGSVGIYRTQAGSWRIKILGSHFKNKGRVGKDLYDVPVAGWLTNLVTDYVKEFRPVLIGDSPDSGYLFVSSEKGGRFDALNRQVFTVTKKYIPQCGGISPQAFRHLVATDWLMKNPNDFLTVAELLNDSVAVVIKTYAHLKKETSFSRYEEYIARMKPDK